MSYKIKVIKYCFTLPEKTVKHDMKRQVLLLNMPLYGANDAIK